MAKALDLVKQLIEHSAHLDIETTGLQRGSGILETSIFVEKDKSLFTWHHSPNLTRSTEAIKEQDITKLVSSALDRHVPDPELQKLGSKATWRDVALAETLINEKQKEKLVRKLTKAGFAGPATLEGIRKFPNYWEIFQDSLNSNNKFLADQIKAGHLPQFNVTPTAPDGEVLKRELNLHGGNVQRVVAQTAAVENVLLGHGPGGDAFRRAIKDKTLWIANAEFESKQFGAVLATAEAEVWDSYRAKEFTSKAELQKRLSKANWLREQIAGTSSSVSDIFYVTGSKVNSARAAAKLSGDWSPLFRTILENTAAGSGEIRDTLDLVRSQQSMMQKAGLLSGSTPHSLSMDVQGRLHAYAKTGEISALFTAEKHMSAWDTAITQREVFRQSLIQQEALQEYLAGTTRGQELGNLAKQRQGPLYEAMRYAAVQEASAKHLQTINLEKRMARVFQNFAANNETVEHYAYRTNQRDVFLRDGTRTKVDGLSSIRRKFTNIEKALEYVMLQDSYQAADKDLARKNVIDRLVQQEAITLNKDAGNVIEIRNRERLALSSKFLAEEGGMKTASRRSLTNFFESDAFKAKLDKSVNSLGLPKETKQWNGLLNRGLTKGSAKMFGMFALGIGTAGAFGALMQNREQRRGPESIRHVNYERWLANQSNMFGLDNSHMQKNGNQFNITGLSHGGVNPLLRKMMSDFGSPYRGPVASNSVFEQFGLLEDRERILRNQYARNHYDPASAVGSYFNAMTKNGTSASFGQNGGTFFSTYNYAFDQMTPFNPRGTGLKGKNLLQLDLSSGNWKFRMTDADTISIQRAGIQNTIASWFGHGQEYNFRLQGIDAPEIAHGGKAQPYADKAKELAKAMVNNAQNLRLVVNPDAITYGRGVGVLLDHNKDLNREFVRKGMAAFLPIKGKNVTSMIENSTYVAAESMSRSSQKGMWSTPYFQAYDQIVEESGTRFTFNTLMNSSRLARNSSLLSTRALMDNAQSQGFYSTASAIEATEISKRIKSLGKNVYDKEGTGENWRTIHTFNQVNSPHKNYMNQQLREVNSLMKTRGSSEESKLAGRNFKRLNKSLVLDSMKTSTNVFSKKKGHHRVLYDTDKRIKEERSLVQQRLQKQVNHYIMSNDSTGRYRM